MRSALATLVWITSCTIACSEELDISVDDQAMRLGFTAAELNVPQDKSPSFQFGGAVVQPHVRIGVSADDDRQATYASAGFALPFGEFDLGRPRSILDLGPLPNGAPGVPQTMRPLAEEAALDDLLGAGLRVAGSQGAVSFGTSFHTLEQSSLTVLGVAGRYDVTAIGRLDAIAVYGGAESDGAEQRFRLGTEMTRGITTAGVDLLTSNENDGRTLSQVYIGVAVTPNVSLGLSGLRERTDATDTTDTRFGLGASVTTQGGAFFRGGVDGVTSDDPAFGLSVGFEF